VEIASAHKFEQQKPVTCRLLPWLLPWRLILRRQRGSLVSLVGLDVQGGAGASFGSRRRQRCDFGGPA